jgi:hypothetical protein
MDLQEIKLILLKNGKQNLFNQLQNEFIYMQNKDVELIKKTLLIADCKKILKSKKENSKIIQELSLLLKD